MVVKGEFDLFFEADEFSDPFLKELNFTPVGASLPACVDYVSQL